MKQFLWEAGLNKIRILQYVKEMAKWEYGSRNYLTFCLMFDVLPDGKGKYREV